MAKEPTKKELSQELADAKDMLLRTAAEYENFRKRTAKEKSELYTSVAADTASKLLPALDSLELALSFETTDEKKLREGLELTLKQLKKGFEDIGVAEIETESFDPRLHDAVMHTEDESLPENSVTKVLRKGYRLGDKVLRPASVTVAN